VHLPHGYQNGVLLPHVAAFNRGSVAPATVAEIDELDALYATIGFGKRFEDGELSEADVELMVAAALSNPFRENNRRAADADDLHRLLAAAAAPPAG
jgi:alcohol dehydrogenase class IV